MARVITKQAGVAFYRRPIGSHKNKIINFGYCSQGAIYHRQSTTKNFAFMIKPNETPNPLNLYTTLITSKAPKLTVRTHLRSILVHLQKMPFLRSLIFKDLLLFLVDGIYFAPFRSP
jgi:hypothetical protein